MRHLRLLTKVSLGGIFNFNKIFEKKQGKENIKRTLGLIGVILLAIIIAVTSYFYSYGIGFILDSLGQLDLLPELMMALVSVLVLISTISRVKGTLFGFKDYDLLMSLPIDNNIIVASRLLILYIINFAFALIIMLPSNIAYGVLARPGLLFYIYSFVTLFIIPIIPMVVGTIIGTIIVYISSKMKRSNLVNILLNIILLVGILFVSLVTSSSEEAVSMATKTLANTVDDIYPLSSLYKAAVVDYKIASLIIFIGISLAIYAVYVVVIGKRFKGINTSLISFHTSTKKKKRKYSRSSPFMALYKKELSRYFSSSVYVLNTGFSMVLLLILAIATLFIKNESLDQLLEIPGFTDLAGTYLPIAIPFFVSLVYTSACSISLEGENLWILKSIPVTSKEIFHSKIGLNLSIILPTTYISIIILSIGLKLEIIHVLITLAMATAYAFSTSITGLLVNLIFPVFDWKSEVSVIKQSLASLIALLGGMVVSLIPIGGHYFLGESLDGNRINLIVILLISLATVIIYRILITKGSKMFEDL